MSDDHTIPEHFPCPNCKNSLDTLARRCDLCGRTLQVGVKLGAVVEKREAYHAARHLAELLPDLGVPVGTVAARLLTGDYLVNAPNYPAAHELARALQGQGMAADVNVETATAAPDRLEGAPYGPVEWIRRHATWLVVAALILAAAIVLTRVDVGEKITTALQGEPPPPRTMEDVRAEQERAREHLRRLHEQGQQHLERQEGTFRRHEAVLPEGEQTW